MTRILITGASGFVGSALTNYLNQNTNFGLRLATRQREPRDANTHVYIEDINELTDWKDALNEIDVVIHLAARVHVMSEKESNPAALYRTANTLATINLAEQAEKAGVKRFIFLSSIKVNGEATLPFKPFTADEIANPTDPYGISKRDAELGLLQLSQRSSMEVVIIRPPLIYGSGVKANFLSLIKLVKKFPVMPFLEIPNKRSLVSIDNLNNFITLCIQNPAAKNQIFLVSDGEDISTTQLIREIAEALEKRVVVMHIPLFLLKLILFVFNKNELSKRLFSSLQVDISKNKFILGWAPAYSIKDTLKKELMK